MYYILYYQTEPHYLQERGQYREEHLARVQALAAQGIITMAGAFAEPADGAILVFKTTDPSIVRQFATDDPYVQNGLIKQWWVRKWSLVVGDSVG